MSKVPSLLGSADLDLEGPDEASPSARRLTTNGAVDFLVDNAVALGFLGLGAGLLSLLSAPRGRAFAVEHPLTTGAVAVATGVGIAITLPATELERRTLGPVARSLSDQARGLVDHVRADVRTVRRAASGLRDALSPSPDTDDLLTRQADRPADVS